MTPAVLNPAASKARATRVRVLAAFVVAGALTLFPFLDFRLLLPLYDRGVAQPVLGYLNGLAILLQFPGLTVGQIVSHHPAHYLAWVTLVYAANFGTYFVVTLVALVAFRRAFARRPKPPAADSGPRHDPSRRRFLATSVSSLYASGALLGSYSLLVEPRAFRVGRYTIPIDDLPPSLDGLTLAQVTDVHHCRWLPVSHIDHVVRTTNALNPDLILLTGDYTLHSPTYVAPAIAALAKLRARIGTVAVLGNHDWHGPLTGPLTQACLRAANIPLLDNTRLLLTADRRLVPCPPVRRADRGEGLILAGVGDLWRDRQDYHAALGGLPTDLPRLLLSHNPDVAEDPRFLSCGHRCDLIISGHTHGGQIRLPLVGSPWIPSRFGERYARGLVDAPTTRVFTSPGIGMTELPVRFASPPEISLLTLRRPAASA